ncbi:uncharacterized protein LOC119837745 [Zerene cesonia]|uniref:uncharacterized protein LOC119837745 n=1 Tax=Zerene cesonia TaxID=33412 RepID=UPI0018E5A02E|nr:uncharacterized protein LOC119837745 [Zerene cesonia]
MMFKMRLRCQTLVVLCYVVLTAADRRNDLAKLLSLSASNGDRPAVNVNASDIPSSYSSPYVSARTSRSPPEFQKYAFRPRALNAEKAVYYAKDNLNMNTYKSEILFPGNYIAIAKEKSSEDRANDAAVSGRFQPQTIPLTRDPGFEARSLDDDDDDEENEKPEEFSALSATRRSLSYIFGGGEAEAEEDEEEDEVEDEDHLDGEFKGKHKKKKSKLKYKKRYSKYMMPLLMAYKLKYLAIVPVMIGGLVLLVGATGLAGFFFALFAATMALQKGGY